MSARLIALNFVEPKTRNKGVGAVLLAIGLGSIVLALGDIRSAARDRDDLQSQLAAVQSDGDSGRSGTASRHSTAENRAVVEALATPWSLLMQELDAASRDSRDSVAVLAVEPDQHKHRVRVVAEARNLTDALAYIERLQQSRVLRLPMLDSHAVRTDDSERPVRFQVSAEWKDQP